MTSAPEKSKKKTPMLPHRDFFLEFRIAASLPVAA
jgi:hypothetical protein